MEMPDLPDFLRMLEKESKLEKRFIRKLTMSETDDLKSMKAEADRISLQMSRLLNDKKIVIARSEIFWDKIKKTLPPSLKWDSCHLNIDDADENLLEVIHPERGAIDE